MRHSFVLQHAVRPLFSQGSEMLSPSKCEMIERRAIEFSQLGVKMLDALHLAAAEVAGADYFCTCDDRFLRRAKTLPNLKMMIVAPLQLIEEIDL